MRKSLVSGAVICVYMCIRVKWRDIIPRCTVCTTSNTLQTTNEEKCVPVYSMCAPRPLYSLPFLRWQTAPSRDVYTTDILLCYVILIVCVFNLHRTIQSNYRVILCSPQTKSQRVESSGRTRSPPFRPRSIHYGITMITFWAPRSLAMLGSICLSTAQLHLAKPYLLTWQRAHFNWIQCGALTTMFFIVWLIGCCFHMASLCKGKPHRRIHRPGRRSACMDVLVLNTWC